MADLLNIIIIIASIVGVVIWLRRLRHWPLTIAVVIALGSNAIFYFIRALGILSPLDLNLLSSVRVLLMVIVIAAIPYSVVRS